MATAPVAPKHLLVLAGLESLVLLGVSLRLAVLRDVDLDQPLHLAWLIGTVVLAGGAIALYVVRSAGAARDAGEAGLTDDARRTLLAPSVGVLALAAMVALAGPTLLARLTG